MKSKTKTIIFYIISALILVIIHTTFELNTKDDIFFSKIELQNLFEWLNTRYNIWTSRLLIESVLVILLKLPSIVWCILNSLIILLISYSISYLFSKNNFKDKITALFLVCLYPLSKVSEAGWYATTLNYLWPLGIGLFSLFPIKHAIVNKKDNVFMKIIYSLALLFACNQEQMCALIVGFYFVFIIYLYKKKNNNHYIKFQFILSFLSLIFILTCPGNDSRMMTEVLNWYPEFITFNIFKKGIVGFLSTISKICLSIEIPMIALVLIIPYLLRKEKLLIKINSYIPMFIILIFNFVNKFRLQLKIYDQKIIDLNLQMLPIILLGIILIISIILSLYFIFKKVNRDLKYLIPLIFVAGLSSRLILSFSPTVYASGIRTYIFYDFSIIIILFLLLKYYITTHFLQIDK